MRVMLHVTNRKEKKQCAGYYGLQIEKRTNSVRDTTGYKQKREQAVCVILQVTNRKDNQQCA